MKTTLKKAFSILSLALLTFSCGSDDDTTTSTNNLTGNTLQGSITSDLNVPAGNYFLKGTVHVKSGATLTIQPGTTFTVSAADQAAGTNYLLVEQGGRLIANGTSTMPIIFTSESASIGSWGGLILNGKARINVTGGTEIAEAGGMVYGGTNDTDNSGSLKYVRVEYAGAAITGGTAEYNSFSFFGLGSGTVLENLQAYKGADDGFEFFGGTVNATNLAAFGCEDDSIDWDRGYTGTLNNIWVIQPSNGDWAFETSNHPSEFNNAPRSNPTVTNVTIVGNNNASKAAFLFKEGTAASISNVVATQVGYGVRVNTQLTEVNNNTLNVTNANFTTLSGNVYNGVDATDISAAVLTTSTTATGANAAPFTTGTWLKAW